MKIAYLEVLGAAALVLAAFLLLPSFEAGVLPQLDQIMQAIVCITLIILAIALLADVEERFKSWLENRHLPVLRRR